MQTSWRPFFWVSAALCAGTMGTALASPLYPLYQILWDLKPSEITYIFIAYMAGVMSALLFLGKVSNHYGFLPILKAGLSCTMIGLVLSAWATGPLMLGISRYVIGIATGMISTSAMLGLTQVTPASHRNMAGQLSSMISVLGFGSGPLISGWIAQFSERPLLLPYLPVIAACILIVFMLGTVKQEARTAPGKPSLKPRLELPEAAARPFFLVTSMAAFCVFGMFSLYGSLSASFIAEMIPWQGPAISGTALASILFVSGITQFFLRSHSVNALLRTGLIVLIIACITLAITMITHSSMMFVLSDIFTGLTHGITLLATFGIVNYISKPENRGPLFSTFLFIGYLGTILPIVAVGLLADAFGLMTAVIIFCISMSLLAIALLLLAWKHEHRQNKAT